MNKKRKLARNRWRGMWQVRNEVGRFTVCSLQSAAAIRKCSGTWRALVKTINKFPFKGLRAGACLLENVKMDVSGWVVFSFVIRPRNKRWLGWKLALGYDAKARNDRRFWLVRRVIGVFRFVFRRSRLAVCLIDLYRRYDFRLLECGEESRWFISGAGGVDDG